MKIIIDIPEQLYKEIMIHGRSDDDLVCSYIQEGTLLGNGHGRLIDADNLMEYCLNQKSKTIDCNDIARFGTIIPANEEAENEEDWYRVSG